MALKPLCHAAPDLSASSLFSSHPRSLTLPLVFGQHARLPDPRCQPCRSFCFYSRFPPARADLRRQPWILVRLANLPILEGLITDPTQVVGRTLDAPRWYVIGYPCPPLTPRTNSRSEWVTMGGEICNNCQDCIGSELCVDCDYSQQSTTHGSNNSTASSPRPTRTPLTKSSISIGKPGSPRPTFNV
jgi:hypothetical protein